MGEQQVFMEWKLEPSLYLLSWREFSLWDLLFLKINVVPFALFIYFFYKHLLDMSFTFSPEMLFIFFLHLFIINNMWLD